MPELKINAQLPTSCFSGVGAIGKCSDCSGNCIKYGKTKTGKQRYLCNVCNVSFVANRLWNGYGQKYDLQIIQLKTEGLGIRSTARILGISPATVVRKILKIADRIVHPGFRDLLAEYKWMSRTRSFKTRRQKFT
jgi:transposase-like protein